MESKSQPVTLLIKQREKAMKSLEKESPTLVQQIRQLDAAISALQQGPGQTYSGIRGLIEAIEMCLGLHDAWMDKDQILNALIEGGYPLDPASGRLVIHHAIKYHARPGGRLIRRDEDGTYAGLPAWAGNSRKKILK